MDLRRQMPWLFWAMLFTMLCIDKGSFLNLDLMIYGNYVVIMIMLMPIYVYMYICMPLFDRVVMDHDCLMLMFICICVCMYVVV